MVETVPTDKARHRRRGGARSPRYRSSTETTSSPEDDWRSTNLTPEEFRRHLAAAGRRDVCSPHRARRSGIPEVIDQFLPKTASREKL